MFDASSAPCWTGTIPETARKRANALRSLHPTHSVVAFGKLARWFTTGHELVHSPCGFGSPYDKLADVAGKVVLIGVTQAGNTSIHHAEEVAGVPFALQEKPFDITITDTNGGRITLQNTYLHLWQDIRDFIVLEGQMIDYGICRIGKVQDAEVRVMDAMLQRMYLVQKMLADPLTTLRLSERQKWIDRTR